MGQAKPDLPAEIREGDMVWEGDVLYQVISSAGTDRSIAYQKIFKTKGAGKKIKVTK